MNVSDTVLAVLDQEQEEILAYVTIVEGSWFAVSMLETFLYTFEVQDQKFADFVYENGAVINLDILPEDVYKCFTATFLVLAERLTELGEDF